MLHCRQHVRTACEWRKNKEKTGLCASSSDFYIAVLRSHGMKCYKMALSQGPTEGTRFCTVLWSWRVTGGSGLLVWHSSCQVLQVERLLWSVLCFIQFQNMDTIRLKHTMFNCINCVTNIYFPKKAFGDLIVSCPLQGQRVMKGIRCGVPEVGLLWFLVVCLQPAAVQSPFPFLRSMSAWCDAMLGVRSAFSFDGSERPVFPCAYF